MQLNDAQIALRVALIAALPPDLPVLWDNRYSFDLGTEQRTHLRTELIVHDAVQKSLGNVKVVRYLGVYAMLVCTREGNGVAEAISLATTIISAMQFKNLGGLQVKEVSPERAVCNKGWYQLPVSAAFWFDEVVVNPE